MDYEAEYNKLKTEHDELKSEARKWEERSKTNYKGLQDAQTALAERDKSLEDATSRLSELESNNGDMKAKLEEIENEKAHAALVSEVAEAKQVDSAVLRGSTREELEAHADSILSAFQPSAPVVPDQAKTPGEQPSDPAREAVRGLFGNE